MNILFHVKKKNQNYYKTTLSITFEIYFSPYSISDYILELWNMGEFNHF